MSGGLRYLNREIAAAGHQFELVKGDGYFYFADTGESLDCVKLDSTSVMVPHFAHMSLTRWRREVSDLVARIKALKEGVE